MMVYIGLDLGVDLNVVTNSVAHRFHPRKRLDEMKEDNIEQGQYAENVPVTPISIVLDLRPDDEAWTTRAGVEITL
jgi:hypothetical protein